MLHIYGLIQRGLLICKATGIENTIVLHLHKAAS